MRDLVSSGVAGWLVRGTSVVALAAALVTAGCGDDGEPVPLFPAFDAGSDARGMEDRAPDTPSDRGNGGDTRADGTTTGGDTGAGGSAGAGGGAGAAGADGTGGAGGTAGGAGGTGGSAGGTGGGGDGATDGPRADADASGSDARADGDAGDARLDVGPEAPTPTCDDMMKNGNETDIDCGGMCSATKKCADGKGCLVAGDCTSGVCPSSHICATPTCMDTVKNGNETDTDCGGSCLPNSPCADGKTCGAAADCQSGVCSASHVCSVPACDDTVKNGTETDIDCGGSCTTKCANGRTCGAHSDCTSGICNASHVCIAASCTNMTKDTNETGVDCGGADCGPCDDGIACAMNSDCKSGKCTNLVCTAPSCTDMVKNGTETDVDCGGSCTTKCDNGKLCSGDGDCTSGHCPSGACVECVAPANCPGDDTDCHTRTCTNNVCGVFNVQANTPTPDMTQTAGNCHTMRCDGNGGVTNAVDDGDLPVDNNQCTSDLCSGGAPTNPTLTGTPCDQSGGTVCSSAGNGTCVQCNGASTCPGEENECQTRTCDNHACGFNYTTPGTLANVQMAGDCHTRKCAGAAGIEGISNEIDNLDVFDDGNECTDNVCMTGVPSNPLRNAGAPCSQNGGLLCNDVGQCVQCLTAATCPGMNNECQTKTCSAMGVCGFNRQMAGFVTPTQAPGDCHTNKCDDMGNVVNTVDDGDLPADGNQCSADTCSGGTPSNEILTGTACNQMGGTICSSAANGICVECNVPANCGADAPCAHRTCINHACGVAFEPVDTIVGPDTPNDCKKNYCDGNGNLTNDDADVPLDDGKFCTVETCAAGVPSHPGGPMDGAICTGPQGGRCGSGDCLPTFMVLRVGVGGTTLGNASTALFVERRYFNNSGGIVPANGGVANGTITVPTAVNGMNQPLTIGGTASSEGFLTLSPNGQYVTLAGYAVGPGIGGVGGSSGGAQCVPGTTGCAALNNTFASTTPRVIGRIDASNNIDTTTTITNAFDRNNVRGAVTTDGTAFWVTGSTGTGSGVQYVTLGQSTGIQLLASGFATRAPLIADGQLYVSSNNTGNATVFTVGTGVPITGGQTATNLPGTSAANLIPDEFILFDRNPNVAGVDTLYIADERPTGVGGGVLKWTFDGAIWTNVATFTNGLVASGGVRGIAGVVNANNDVVLIASTAEGTSANKLIMYTDNGVNTNPTGTVLANGTASSTTGFRGLCLAP